MNPEIKSSINIIFDDKLKNLVAEFKEKHHKLLKKLEKDWHFEIITVQETQQEIRDLLPSLFEKCNLADPKKKCGQPEIYALALCLISPIDDLNCWKDFNFRNEIMRVEDLTEKYTDDFTNCVCVCSQKGCNVTNMGQVYHKSSLKKLLVGSNCIMKRELLDCDLIQKAHAKLERKKKKEKKEAKAKETQRVYEEKCNIWKKEKEIKEKERESKINFVKSHLFCNITVEQMWKFHDFIQLYYDNKCHLTDYDNKLDELVKDIKQGKYSKI
jgi:hypothetical protein